MKAARTRALHKKHAGTAKHAATAKHSPTAQKKAATAHGQKAKRTAAAVKAAHLRAWTPDVALALCVPLAFHESLRIWGRGAVRHGELGRVLAHAGLAGSEPTSILAARDAILAAGLAQRFERVDLDDPAAAILGLDMPEGRHAVALDPSGLVWSWRGLYEMTAEAVIEEAWAVTWC